MSHPLRSRPSERGAALVLALLLVALLLVLGVAMIRIAGTDRVDAAKMGVRERAQICAEAGLQYGRRFFGQSYEATHNWNDYLDRTLAGYRYDPAAVLAELPGQVLGKSDGTTFDAGADLDGDGRADFWVSLRDNDDERPLGGTDNPDRDNDESVILRAECINPAWRIVEGGQETRAVIEAVFTHIQGSSGYGNAQITSNSPDIVGGN